MRHISIASGVCVVLALVGACASPPPKVTSHVAPTANFSKYATFGIFPNVAGKSVEYQSFVAQYIRESITRQMQARGFQLAENPDLQINFNIQTKDLVSVRQTPGGYYGYRRGMYSWAGQAYETEVSSYTQGTLNVDVVDRVARQLLWEGVAIGKIREESLKDPQGAVEAVIAQIYETFPKPAAGASAAR